MGALPATLCALCPLGQVALCGARLEEGLVSGAEPLSRLSSVIRGPKWAESPPFADTFSLLPLLPPLAANSVRLSSLAHPLLPRIFVWVSV